MNTFSKILAPIKRQIYMLIGRAIVSYIGNTGATQRLQLKLLADEVCSDVERFEEYGFTTYPLTDSEAVSAFLNGNRSHGIILCVHDRRYRPTDLAEGEVCIYTSEDTANPKHRIHFKAGRIIEVKCQDSILDIAGDRIETIDGDKSITVVGSQIKSNASDTETVTGTKQVTAALVNMIAASIIMNGSVVLGGAAGSGKAVATEDIVNLFNNHTHNENGDGGGVTDPPNQTLTAAHMTSNTKAV